jgi:SprT protein
MTNSEVWEWIRFACDCHGRPDIVDRIQLEWSNRMTNAMGRASRKGWETDYTIKLSTKLFARASDAEKRQTVIHEACHIIDAIINDVRMSHGPSWKDCMRRADCEPLRCHSVSNAGLVKAYHYTCPNGCHEFMLSARMHNSVLRGKHRICKTCKSRISWNGRVTGG